MDTNKKERIEYFDYLKGLLITLVVLGHITPESTLRHIWLYSWHMPAFFIVNGILLKHTYFYNKSFFHKGVLHQGIKRLMIPYCIYGSALLIIRWIFDGCQMDNLRWQLIDLFTLCGIGATWFLPCLFIAQVLLWIINKLGGVLPARFREICCVLLSCLLLLIALFVPQYNVVMFVIFRGFIGAFFLYIGSMIHDYVLNYRNKEITVKVIVATVLLTISVVLFVCFEENDSSINVLKFGNPFLFVFNALIGTAGAMAIVALLEDFVPTRFLIPLSYYGKESLTIMGTHQILMLLMFVPIKDNILVNIIMCVLVMLSEIPVIIIVNKLKKLIDFRESKKCTMKLEKSN